MDISELCLSVIPHVVAAEVGKDSFLHIFCRNEKDSVEEKLLPFHPFVLLTDAVLLNGFPGKFEAITLKGYGLFHSLIIFPALSDYETAKKFLKEVTGFNPSSPNSPYRVISDLTQQALILQQIRLFQQMDFHSVRRMQFDIETLCEPGYDFPNPERENDSIIIIGMSDNTGWEKVLSVRNMSEKQLLQEFVKTVQQRDPDILEGHNLFRFDLPYIETRAKRWKVPLKIGRDGSVPQKRTSRFNVAERTVNYTRYDIFGRHIVDTMFLAYFYDAVKRDLDGYGLKTIAKHFHLVSENRVYAEAAFMNREWAENPERAMAYCLDDVRETRAISDILSPSYFYETQILPFSYQNCIVRGNATKIDSFFLAEYLKQRQSISCGERSRPFSGALTRSFHTGLFDNICHCDVRSLYPSIILSENWIPRNDSLDVFRNSLRTLREFRLNAKDSARVEQNPIRKEYYSSIQQAFKILINSFYGYLGFEQGFLNDFDMAERITAKGREILTLMLNFLDENHSMVIEMDTDGIYFHPPEHLTVQELHEKLNRILPKGIDVDFDEHYIRMFSYKSKNYALLKENGEMVISGAALKSRGLEPFQRKYIQSVISALLHRDLEKVSEIYTSWESRIKNHEVPFSDLAKSEVLSDSLDSYKKKMTASSFRRSAPYELAISSGKAYQPGDKVSFYVVGTKKKVSVVDNAKLLSEANENNRDENVDYYLAELEELQKKFEPFLFA